MIKALFMAALLTMVQVSEATDCAFPDTEQGTAPAWLCGDLEREDIYFTAVVQRSRLPSISLQSRLAGREAMAAVVSLLLADAANTLAMELGGGQPLQLPEADDIERLKRFDGVRIFEKVKSPRRALYVLAGVEEENLTRLKVQARTEVLQENRTALEAELGQAGFAELLKSAAANPEATK